jgi:hypothetical protein
VKRSLPGIKLKRLAKQKSEKNVPRSFWKVSTEIVVKTDDAWTTDMQMVQSIDIYSRYVEYISVGAVSKCFKSNQITFIQQLSVSRDENTCRTNIKCQGLSALTGISVL